MDTVNQAHSIAPPASPGLTLVELLVVLAIMGILGIALYSLFQTHNRQTLIQEETALMQQELLSAMVIMADSIRMCGYSPNMSAATGLAGFQSPTNTTYLNCTRDMNGNGTIDTSDDEIITFRFNATDNTIQTASAGSVSWQPFAINIGDLQFTYFDDEGNIIADPNSNLGAIKMVEINATAVPSANRAAMGIPNHTMSTRVFVRNLQ
ncbi:MAG: hypothetical protein PWQ64_1424 [Desulfomicrobiaceae bacterium]|nr:hypothetical protein [Desulfomicrobiaceae bacterium]